MSSLVLNEVQMRQHIWAIWFDREKVKVVFAPIEITLPTDSESKRLCIEIQPSDYSRSEHYRQNGVFTVFVNKQSRERKKKKTIFKQKKKEIQSVYWRSKKKHRFNVLNVDL